MGASTLFLVGSIVPGLLSLKGAKVTLVAGTTTTCSVCIVRRAGLVVGPVSGNSLVAISVAMLPFKLSKNGWGVYKKIYRDRIGFLAL